MKAVVCTKYGPPEVLQVKDIPKPVPGENEFLIRIHATTVSTADVIDRSCSMPWWLWLPARLSLGIRKPKKPVLGFEMAGKIEAVGKNIRLFNTGDLVFASTFEFGFGCYAEYICIPETGTLSLMPENITYEEAAAIPLGGLTALTFIRDRLNIKNGQKILIFGASGSIGTYAVQLSKYYGAEVTGVCGPSNLELIKSLGADNVIDYTSKDPAKNGETYDVIFDVLNKTSFSRCKSSLKPGGIYATTFPALISILQMILTSTRGGKRVISGEASEKAEDLFFLKGLVEDKRIKPVIDRQYRLEEIAEAHRYVEQGHKRGNVAITV